MNKNKLIKIALVVLFMIFGTKLVFASPPAPVPTCQIDGTIKSVEFKDAYNEPCLSQPHGCPTDMEVRHPARYFLKVSINSVSYISGTGFNTCENMYPVGSVQTIIIGKDKVKPNDTFTVNKKIEGVVSSFGINSFDSYNLKSETDINRSAIKGALIAILGVIFIVIILTGIIYKIKSSRKRLFR